MTDRFDLEQEIIQCWSVVDDLKSFAEEGATAEELSMLAMYYQRKFNRLWNTFDELIAAKKII